VEPGQTIGQYTLVRYLGKGGMAEVWEARHSYLATKGRLAVKCLLPQFATNVELQERFLREAQRQLDHPYIISAVDFFQIGGLSYMVMKYVPPPGPEDPAHCLNEKPKSLEDRLAEHHPLTLEEVHTYSCDVLSALEYAHSQGVVHRDVKPANVLLHRNGHAMLTDFGIAKGLREERSMTRVGTSMGTPDYMSPEQIKAPQLVDARSDVYSFGCVLYAMLSRFPPFGNEDTTEYEIKDRHVRFTPPPLVFWNRDLPRDIGNVVFKCLEKNPPDRYQSCEEVMLALDEALYPKLYPQEEVVAPPEPPILWDGPADPSSEEPVDTPTGVETPRDHITPQRQPSKTEPLPPLESAASKAQWASPSQPQRVTSTNPPPVTIHPVKPPSPPTVYPIAAQHGSKMPMTAGIVIVVALAAVVLGWFLIHKTSDTIDWTKVDYSDSRLTDCKGVEACLARKAQADKLLAVDWQNIAYNSPLLEDCMGYAQCVNAKSSAALLMNTSDWLHADKALLAHCMQYPQCTNESLRRSAPVAVTRPKPSSSDSTSGEGAESWTDCCRDSSNPALCKKQKKAAGIFDCPTGK
jgi:serine/threonine protein kinase